MTSLKRVWRLLLVTCLFFSIFIFALNNESSAVTVSDWVAGNIIDDSLFVNKDAMTVEQIQSFLNNKVGTGTNGVQGQCDTNGTRTSELGGGTRAQYGAAHSNPAPFTCLKDFYEVPKTTPGPSTPDNNYGGKPIPVGAKSAAQLIWDASQQYNISPKVLLVKLGTESAGPLTSDDWPFLSQYKYAMGAHCPDIWNEELQRYVAKCDPNYSGFSIQISESVKLLRGYLDDMNESWWPYRKPYQINSIMWQVGGVCGSGDVYIGNKATAALYTYTPYQPNQAALNNMYGSGDGCSAYGNRNFWRTFIDWFGTVRDYVPLDTPRWMKLATDTYKKDPVTGENIGTALPKDTSLKFTTKLFVNGKMYLRTEYDTRNNIDTGILMTDLVEIPYMPFITPRFLKITSYTHKRRPSSESIDYNQPFDANYQIKFSSKILINNKTYFRTEYDTLNNNDLAIPASVLDEIQYDNFIIPRFMKVNSDITKINPVTETNDPTIITKGSQILFNSKIFVNDKWYYRTETDTLTNSQYSINYFFLENLQLEPFGPYPKWLRLKQDSTKVSTNTAVTIPEQPIVPSGIQLLITDKIFINGQWYYQTMYDSTNHKSSAIISDNFEEIPFIPMQSPRTMKMKMSLQKVDPKTGQLIDFVLPKDMSVEFATKIFVNGIWYLRTKFDTDNNFDKGIPYCDLYEST